MLMSLPFSTQGRPRDYKLRLDRHVYQHQRSPAKTEPTLTGESLIPTCIPTSCRAPHPPPATQPLQIPLESLSMLEVSDLAASEVNSERSIIDYRWPCGRARCPHLDCSSAKVRERRGYKRRNQLPVQFVCQTCGRPFTVRTNYFLARSRLPFRTWFWALYIVVATSEDEPPTPALLVRELGVSEASATFMLRRIRKHVQTSADCRGRPRPHQEMPTGRDQGRSMLPAPSGPNEPSHRETTPQ